MNDDYLWDKTGEPDPEIQNLEEILGALRYQPKPLDIPQELPAPRHRRNHFPVLAIAASVLLALIAAGVWLRVRTQGESQPQHASAAPAPVVEEKAPDPVKPANKELATNEPAKKRDLPPLSRHTKHRSPTLARHEREEALAAKEQVMLALRLTSEKLSMVHKKTQSNQIKNQHRVG